MKTTIALLAALLLTPLAALHAADSKPSAPPRDDAAWLKGKGTVVFHDAFEREEAGNLATSSGNIPSRQRCWPNTWPTCSKNPGVHRRSQTEQQATNPRKPTNDHETCPNKN